MTYEKPKLTRFGTMRELTCSGVLGVGDGASVLCAEDCCAPARGGRS
jgi:hypothetical protein